MRFAGIHFWSTARPRWGLLVALVFFAMTASAAVVPPVLVQREANRWPVDPAGVVVALDAPTSTTFTLFIPAAFSAEQARAATLTLHFHGAGWFMQQEHTRRGASHPLVVANAKAGDAVYETDIMAPGVMDSLVKQVAGHLSASADGALARVARIELSGFSAGYAGVRGVLRLPAYEPLVSRVMLNDSGYVGDGPDSVPPDDRKPRSGPDGITPFVDFARKAAAGEREFLMEFSSTPSFRSVGPMDCARSIIAALEIPVVHVAPDSMPAARLSADYQLAWTATRGGAHFWCYRAAERPIHLAHVRNQADMWRALDGRSPAELIPVMTPRDIRPTIPAAETTLLDLGTSGTIALYIPAGYKVPKDGAVELTMHFHGATWYVIQEHQRRGNGGPIVAFELGQGSTAYRVPFEGTNRFADVQAAVLKHLREKGAPAETHIAAVDITSVSAGYGAVREIVKSNAHVNLIRRIILADSLYGGLDETHSAAGKRVPAMENVSPWLGFARAAVEGRKTLLVMTSDITPKTYAGCHEVALALTEALALGTAQVPVRSCPAAAPGLTNPLRARADAGGYHWWAYGGSDGQIHLTISRHIGDAWEALDQLGDW